MTTFKEFLAELSALTKASYKDKASKDIMFQLLKRGDKRKAAHRAQTLHKLNSPHISKEH